MSNLQLVTCGDPEAIEIHRDGKSIGVLRWHGGHWNLSMVDPFAIPWNVIELVSRFKSEKDRTHQAPRLQSRPPFVALVYQNGIANVFILDTYQRPESPEGRYARRVEQNAYVACEWFARGMGQLGCTVDTFHCDEAGDIIARPWVKGPGELFQESKLRGKVRGLRMNI